MQPQLSAALIAGELRGRASKSLLHLLAQTALERMEIVVIDLCPQRGPLEGSNHASVRLLPFEQLRYYCEAQALAVRAARSPIVAFIEDHTYASPGWAEAVLEAFHEPSVAAVNYTFTHAGAGSYLARSILMAEYGYWMSPHPGGEVSFASSTNIAYRRDLLLPVLDARGSIFEAEFLLHQAIRKRGGRIVVAPRAEVAHESWRSLRDACLANGANKRALAARRAAVGNWSWPRRLLWAAAMAAMPAVALARLARTLRGRAPLGRAFLLSLPVVAAIYSYSAWAEALGYLFGAGASREEFRRRELAVERNA